MADLAGEKLLMLEDGHCLRDQAMGFCFEAGADEDTHFRATSLETLRNMVAAGSGITLLPALAVPPERKRDGVVYLPCIKPEPRRTIGLVSHVEEMKNRIPAQIVVEKGQNGSSVRVNS